MREIKFRAQNLKGDWIVFTIPMFLNFHTSVFPGDEYYGFKNWCEYTGLKDAKGVDIFEGDIVAVPYVSPMGDITKDIDRNVSIVFQHGAFMLDDSFDIQPLELWLARSKGEYISNKGNKTIRTNTCLFEIIGNVFEHKELLK